VHLLLVDLSLASEHDRRAEAVERRRRRLVWEPLDQLVAGRQRRLDEDSGRGVAVVYEDEDAHGGRIYPWPRASEDSS
jgi:hypothetical protein